MQKGLQTSTQMLTKSLSHVFSKLRTKQLSLYRSSYMVAKSELPLTAPPIRGHYVPVTHTCPMFPLIHFIVWLASWAGKTNRISRCDWLPELARWSYLARSGYGLCPARKIYHVSNGVLSHIINPLLAKLVRSRWLWLLWFYDTQLKNREQFCSNDNLLSQR